MDAAPAAEVDGALFEFPQVDSLLAGEGFQIAHAAFDLAEADEGFPRRAAVAALEHGLLLRPLGQTLYVMPPFDTRPEEVAFACEAIARTLGDVL